MLQSTLNKLGYFSIPLAICLALFRVVSIKKKKKEILGLFSIPQNHAQAVAKKRNSFLSFCNDGYFCGRATRILNGVHTKTEI